MSLLRQIPVIISVDVEPDPRIPAAGFRAPWKGYEAMVPFLDGLRGSLRRATGSRVRYGWFFSMHPQIQETYGNAAWAVENYPLFLERLEKEGDIFGLHAHAWRLDKTKNLWIEDWADQSWIEFVIRSSFEAFEESRGASCKAFRFGNSWMNNETLDLLEKLGVEFDLTLEPKIIEPDCFNPEIYRGSFPDMTGALKNPYRPAREDFLKEDTHGRRLWMIPVSTESVQYEFGRFEKIVKQFTAPHLVKPQPMTLYLGLNPKSFERAVDNILVTMERPYLSLVTRSSAAVNPYERKSMEKNFSMLLQHPFADRFWFTTPEEAVEELVSSAAEEPGIAPEEPLSRRALYYGNV